MPAAPMALSINYRGNSVTSCNIHRLIITFLRFDGHLLYINPLECSSIFTHTAQWNGGANWTDLCILDCPLLVSDRHRIISSPANAATDPTSGMTQSKCQMLRWNCTFSYLFPAKFTHLTKPKVAARPCPIEVQSPCFVGSGSPHRVPRLAPAKCEGSWPTEIWMSWFNRGWTCTCPCAHPCMMNLHIQLHLSKKYDTGTVRLEIGHWKNNHKVKKNPKRDVFSQNRVNWTPVYPLVNWQTFATFSIIHGIHGILSGQSAGPPCQVNLLPPQYSDDFNRWGVRVLPPLVLVFQRNS